jgi:hypothetical protein
MANPSQMEFGVTSLADIRLLLHTWQVLLMQEAQASSESSLVCVIVEDRVPGEEVKLCFGATQDVLHKFLQTLEVKGVKFTHNALIPGILILCRIVRDQGEVRVIYSKDAVSPGA